MDKTIGIVDTKEAYIVSQNMKRYGGGFVQILGMAIVHADPSNLKKLKDAFPEYWNKYYEMSVPHQGE